MTLEIIAAIAAFAFIAYLGYDCFDTIIRPWLDKRDGVDNATRE